MFAYVRGWARATCIPSDIHTWWRRWRDWDSHEEACSFSDRKKQPLNETKCYLLPVNCKNTDPLPIQKVNGTVIEVKNNVTYVGDVFNRQGNNNDLIGDRVRKGTVSTISAMTICTDSSMGIYTINSQLLLYHSVFTQTVLNNSKSWTRLSKNDISKLSSVQMKFLKWMLHTPRGTCNSFTLLELGILPIQSALNLRKLSFLHHILHLDENDPVKQVYEEQKRLLFEPNWTNEVKELIEDLNLPNDETVIKSTSKWQWKNITKTAITNKALNDLNDECLSKKKTAGVPRYTSLKKQSYFDHLYPSKARILFKIRAFVYDIKSNRSYSYKDEICRLCGAEKEDTWHILNDCSKVARSTDLRILNVYELSEENMHETLTRFESFQTQVNEIEAWSFSPLNVPEANSLWHINFTGPTIFTVLLFSAMCLFI